MRVRLLPSSGLTTAACAGSVRAGAQVPAIPAQVDSEPVVTVHGITVRGWAPVERQSSWIQQEGGTSQEKRFQAGERATGATTF